MEWGPHKSTHKYLDFLREEMAEFVKEGFWMVLPYDKVKHTCALALQVLFPKTNNDRAPSSTTCSWGSTKRPYGWHLQMLCNLAGHWSGF